MRRDRLAVLALAPVLALAGCREIQINGRTYDIGRGMDAAGDLVNAMNIPPDLELKMGREAAANMAAKYGLFDDAQVLRYVNLVGKTVARNAERRDVHWRFGVLNTIDINAYAAPGGYVFVTKGMLKLLSDEAELAGVLAHEVEHVDRKHALKALRKANLLKAGMKIAELKSGPGLEAASKFLIGLMERGFDKADELDADAAGARLLARAGYDPKGLSRALEEHHAVADNAHASRFASRHPPYEPRMRALAAVESESREEGPMVKKRFQNSVSF